MARPRIVIAANAAWNLHNFRSGLISALIAEGYDVIAAAPSDPAAEDALARLGARFAPVAIDSKGVSPARDLATGLAFARLFRAERPVAFLGYTVKPNVYGSLAAAACGVPAINNISGLGTAFIAKTWLTPVVEALYRVGLARSARVFFQNEDDRAMFAARGLVRAERTQVLPGSGINLADFPATPPPARAPGAMLFLLIARMVRDKGVVEFVDAARSLRARHPAWRFRMVGFLDVANRTAIDRATVDGWVAEGAVEFAGPSTDVRPLIAEADCVVLPPTAKARRACCWRRRPWRARWWPPTCPAAARSSPTGSTASCASHEAPRASPMPWRGWVRLRRRSARAWVRKAAHSPRGVMTNASSSTLISTQSAPCRRAD